MNITNYQTNEGGLVVQLSLSKLDIMAGDRMDKMYSYILKEIADRTVEYFFEVNKDDILSKIDKDVVLNLVTARIKEGIKFQ